ncbi:18S rRna biogenesis protein RCL1 protein [Cardiosporidium cionae]|uniref:18S rRna biogenesis protein RCL1 protein n=1 Tax=Cardiosporidium cionae TaxID=476202 RepID=A0ABQ7JEH5_9APIC|nr:18S rRna biogenesis protein RCL1 protein [Cardiosporidium cionae]|eukprot:KAF8822371.1 18S rRna biogenesis protein RCL1 protein [Cardiosporidium cionae]
MTTRYYRGSNFFKQRIVLSTITCTPVKITDIRSASDSPGLRPFEINLLRLLDRISDGMRLKVDATGTEVFYQPGLLIGSALDLPPLLHNCGTDRSMTYFLEALLLLGPFCKHPLEIKFKGVTHGGEDISIDTFRNVTLPLMKRLGLPEGFYLRIITRGAAPEGGGEVVFRSPKVEKIQPFTWLDEGKVKRIRGVVSSMRLSPQFSNKCIDKTRAVFNNFLPDVWIYNDVCKVEKEGKSIGYGISLVAETIKGSFKGVDAYFDSTKGNFPAIPEMENAESSKPRVDMGLLTTLDIPSLDQAALIAELTSWELLTQIRLGGVVDTIHQYIPIFFMAIAQEHHSCQVGVDVLLSALTPYTVQLIKHIRDFLGVVFEFEEQPDRAKVVVKCVGSGFTNAAAKT